MTKVELHYELASPLSEAQWERIAWATSQYGLLAVKPNATLDGLTVIYDASRLTPADVEAALLGAGIPIQAPAERQ